MSISETGRLGACNTIRQANSKHDNRGGGEGGIPSRYYRGVRTIHTTWGLAHAEHLSAGPSGQTRGQRQQQSGGHTDKFDIYPDIDRPYKHTHLLIRSVLDEDGLSPPLHGDALALLNASQVNLCNDTDKADISVMANNSGSTTR